MKAKSTKKKSGVTSRVKAKPKRSNRAKAKPERSNYAKATPKITNAEKLEQKRLTKLKKIVASIPTTPGIYQFFNEKGEIIYIGKAKSLRKRVQSYFRIQKDASPKLIVLVKKIQDITYVTVDTETEALILEQNLIKQYRPRYNVLMKDDKSYVYLKFTMSEEYPRIDIVRRMSKNKLDLYLGPYMTAYPLKEMLIHLNKLFPFRTCRGEILIEGTAPEQDGDILYTVRTVNIPRVPCLQYHIKRCEAPCLGRVDKDEYRAMIERIIAFFKGETAGLAQELQLQMSQFSASREFEKAAAARDKLKILEQLTRRQTIVSTKQEEFDVLGVAIYEKKAFVTVFQIRNGKLITSHKITFAVTNITTEADVVELFIRDYYTKATSIPKEICVPFMPDFKEALEDFLEDLTGSRTTLSEPQRGFKKNLLNLAMKNADIEATNSASVIGKRDAKKAAKDLAALLLLKKIEHIECYDISHIQGTSKVGSMVVFRNGVPDKSLYKRFIIKSLPEGVSDDFAALTEIVERRVEYIKDDLTKRSLQEEQAKKEKAKNAKKAKKSKGKKTKDENTKSQNSVKKKKAENFAFVPDLIILDGGKGQLSTVYNHMKTLGIDKNLPIIALAKKQEEIFLPGQTESIQLPETHPARMLIQHIRDEAHRFAITFHRSVRSKKMVTSVLDDIKGIGTATKKKLMQEFGSINGIREASDDEIRAHVSAKVLKTLREML